ncbi:MAG: DUF6377 domain-containing protein, partial [Massilibacteroides sp.]|nr:DUF6377 domain-containing protein [Massilibacteroides sp.]
MKESILFCLFLFCSLPSFSASSRMDSLLRELDRAVSERSFYLQKKEQLIAEIIKRLENAEGNKESEYRIYGELFEAYKSFQMDSALSVANRRIDVAARTGNSHYEIVASMNLAEVMMGTGMYKEAFDLLNSQRRGIQLTDVLIYRYHLYHSLYVLMSGYSISPAQKALYRQYAVQYKDSILSVLPEDLIGHQMVRTTRLLAEGRLDDALNVGLDCFRRFGTGNQSVAMSAYTLAEVYEAMGNREEEKRYLAISALGDLKGAVKEYISLRALAVILYEEGDIARAYDYTKCAMEDAIFCNARLRAFEISQMLPIINESYDVKMQTEKNRLA